MTLRVWYNTQVPKQAKWDVGGSHFIDKLCKKASTLSAYKRDFCLGNKIENCYKYISNYLQMLRNINNVIWEEQNLYN